MKVSTEIVFCVLISGATLATLAYCDFGPHHEELSYLPSGIREESTPAEVTTAPKVTTAPEAPGVAGPPFAVDEVQPFPGGQVRTVCAPSSHDQPNGQPAPVPEKASCLERTPAETPAATLPQTLGTGLTSVSQGSTVAAREYPSPRHQDSSGSRKSPGTSRASR